jgi:hypothetical protein
MKKLFWALSLALTVGFTSCSSDDDNGGGASSESFLRVNGTDYDLKSGIIVNYGEEDEGVFNFDVSLYTENFNASNPLNPFGDNSFSEVYFELFTSNQSTLETGTYNYSSSFGTTNTFSFGDVDLDCSGSFFDVDCSQEFSIVGGTFTVNSNGNRFDLEFSVSLAGGGSAEGKYVGTLIAIDSSNDLMHSESTSKKRRLVLE